MIFEGLPCPVDRSWCAQRCCDGAATESLLRRRCADQLRRAHSARRVSTRRAEWGASIIPAGWFKFQFVAHSPRPPPCPWPRNYIYKCRGRLVDPFQDFFFRI